MYQYLIPFNDCIIFHLCVYLYIYIYIYVCLSIHQLIKTWVISTFLLLWIMLLWTFEYKFMCETTFSVLLGIYLGMELQAFMVTLCLTYWGTAHCLPKQVHSFTFPPVPLSYFKLPQFPFPHILVNICNFPFFIF